MKDELLEVEIVEDKLTEKMGFEMHEEVIINKTGERAFIVWFSEEEDVDSFLLEIKGKNEMPHFYESTEFRKLS